MIFFPDGTLTITETVDCAALVIYENRLARGPGDQFHDFGGITVSIWKGYSVSPETVEVYDRATGLTYKMIVAEDETGTLCIGDWVGS